MADAPAALRIAVDGASGAGKTTTARALGEKLGQDVLTPAEDDDGRTALFDWMDYAGGRHRGQAIQTQVIAVPGHRQELRRAIIGLADVVLFVADSTPAGIYESAEAFRDLQSIRAELDPAPGLVVQANKRDASDAHEVDELRALLEVDEDVAVVETIASTGDGVRQAFVFAVRSGLARLDSIDDPADRPALSPDSLEDHLRAIGDGVEPVAAAVPEEDPAPLETEVVDDAPDVAVTATTALDEPEVLADEPEPGPEVALEIEIPVEDVANLETLETTDTVGPIETVDIETVDIETLAVDEPTGDPFGHLPPPPPTDADGTVSAGDRPTWWRRRRAGAGAASR